MTENIAEKVRYGGAPTGESTSLEAQACRLRASLEVASKWLESANKDEADYLGHHAQYMRDTIEQEYATVCFEMEVAERQRIFSQMDAERGDEEPTLSEAKMRAGMVSDALIDAFVIVSESDLERRYSVMGAIRAAMDALPEELPAYTDEAGAWAQDVQGER